MSKSKIVSQSNVSKYSEDWIPIKGIANGMIDLDNKMKVTGVKIRPRNIFILDQNTHFYLIPETFCSAR